MPDLTTKDAMLERMAAATEELDTKFGEYLPLAGGTMTGELIQETELLNTRDTYFVKYTGITTGTAPSANMGGFGLKFVDKNDKELGGIRKYLTSGGVSYTRLQDNWNNDNIFVSLAHLSGGVKAFLPGSSNTLNLGSASVLWAEVFAANGTINTSDERLKDNIEPIPDEVLDAWGDVQWVQYNFKDAIEKKGKAARIHIGLIAQRIIKVFAEHGLDAMRYGVVCYDAWEADDDIAAGDLYSLRYEEALCLESAYQRRELKRLAERIEALESKRRKK